MNIDLGYSYDMPEAALVAKAPSEKPIKHYPTLHLSCGDVLLENLPDEGTLEVTFKVTNRTVSERNGKKAYDLTLEIREILDVEETEEADEEPDDAATALDKLAALESAKDNSDASDE